MIKLYIGNLRWEVTEQQLGDFFSQVGLVESATIILDRETGRSRGFGFVVMKDEEGAREALKLNGTNFEGRAIIIREAQPEAGKEYTETGTKVKEFCLSAKEYDEIQFKVGEKHFLLRREM